MLCAGLLLAACGGEPEQPTPAVMKLPAQTATAPTQAPATQGDTAGATSPAESIQPGVTLLPAATATGFLPEPTTTRASAPTSTAEALVGPHSYPPDVNPLSGLPVADAAVLQRRPLAIKVSNFPRSVTTTIRSGRC